jgi:DNA-binding CsgD family transcriptional regulator
VLGVVWFLYLALTLDVLDTVVEYYLFVNMTSVLILNFHVFLAISTVLSFLTVYCALSCCVYLSYSRSFPWLEALYIILAGASFVYRIFLKAIPTTDTTVGLSRDFTDIVLFAAIVFSVGICIVRYRKIEDDEIRRLIRRIFVVMLVFLPGLVNEVLRIYIIDVQITPVLYVALSVISLVFFLRIYLRRYHIFPQEIDRLEKEHASGRPVFGTYKISKRESDVVFLVLKGYGNGRIADTLYISLPTVKTHVSSIFRKTGVSNRYELMHLLKHHTEV